MYDILIVGGGPAGLSAALYASRAGMKTLLFERMMTGGQLATIDRIENYPAAAPISGTELAGRFMEDATRFGTEFKFEDVLSIEIADAVKTVNTAFGQYEGKTLILATGSEPKHLSLPNEDMLHGRGVSYCATCDGAFFRGKNVCVVGQSAHAIEEAIFLTAHAAAVSMICPYAAPDVAAHGIKTYANTRVTELLETDGVLSAIQITGPAGAVETLPMDGLFVAMGYTPANRLLNAFTLTNTGHLHTDMDMLTEKPGVFAAGDIREKTLRQIVTAASDGAIAAVSAMRYMKKNKNNQENGE